MESREYTEEEIKEHFLNHVRMLVNYWDKDVPVQSQSERLSGLAFSILSAIDGYSGALPAFILAPSPHKDDKKFSIDCAENYYPQNHKSNIKCDIAGSLHGSFFNK